MSGGKKKSSSTSNYSNTQTLSPWSQTQFTNQFNNVRGLLDSMPAGQAYGGDLVAGLSQNEIDARNQYRDNMGSFNGAYDTAGGILDSANYTPQMLTGSEGYDMIRGANYNPNQLGTGLLSDFGSVSDQYMNPYTQDVVDATANDIRLYNDRMNADSQDAALANRAYGGSRQAVAEALNNEAAQRQIASTSANLRYQGYNDAMGRYGSDLDRIDNRIMYGNEQALTGAQWDASRGGMLADMMSRDNSANLDAANFDMNRAGQIANLATNRHNLNMQDVMGLNSLGEVDRGIEQDRMGANYNEWLRQQDDLYRRAAVEQGLLSQIPMLINQSGRQSSTSVEKSNPGLGGMLGTALGAASMFVPGGQFAGMGGLFSNMMKKNTPVSTPTHFGGQ